MAEKDVWTAKCPRGIACQVKGCAVHDSYLFFGSPSSTPADLERTNGARIPDGLEWTNSERFAPTTPKPDYEKIIDLWDKEATRILDGEDWRERFEQKFFINDGQISVENIVELEAFIAKEIEDAERRGRQQNRDEFTNKWIADAVHAREQEIWEAVKGMKKQEGFAGNSFHNAALEQVLAIINLSKK
ncbi:MAG: hypothetical protein WAV09_00875 [Minisyncoccia bacterium]